MRHLTYSAILVITLSVFAPIYASAVDVALPPEITSVDSAGSVDSGSSVRQNMTPTEAKIQALKKQLQDLLSIMATLTNTSTTQGEQTTGQPATSGQPSSQAQATQTGHGPLCVDINRTLSLGSRGDDVSALQEALASDPTIYEDGSVTGYFGKLTRQAVMNLQQKYHIFPAGESTPTGIVGPLTRTFLRGQCLTTAVNTSHSLENIANQSVNTSQQANTSSPKTSFDTSKTATQSTIANFLTQPGATVKLNPDISQIWFNTNATTSVTTTAMDTSKNTSTGSSTVTQYIIHTPAAPEEPPIVTGFYGPKLLTTKQMGTWTVNAVDQIGHLLAYIVDWGETATSPDDALWALAGGQFFKSASPALFQHTYTNPGVYTYTILIKNDRGALTKISDSVAVSAATTTQIAGSAVTGYSGSASASSTSAFGGQLSCGADSCTYTFSDGTTLTYLTQNASSTSLTNTQTSNNAGMPSYFETIGTPCVQGYKSVYVTAGTKLKGTLDSATAQSGGVITLQCKGGMWQEQ